MPPIVKQSLRSLTEDQILRAIASGQSVNLILQELSALVMAYVTEASQLIAQGEAVCALFKQEPGCPIEKIAMGMVSAAFSEKKMKAGCL